MPLGVAAAALVAGTQLVGAKMQSGAAKDAAKTQQTATNQGLQVQQQALQPYQDLGRVGLQQLQNPSFAQPYRPMFGSGQGAQAFQGPQGAQPTLGGIGQPQPPPMPPQGPQARPMGQPQPMQSGGEMLLVEAPTGERRPMPAALAQQAVAKGARIVGRA